VATLVGIAIIMTVGVYGLVAGIVKLDDAGLYLSKKQNGAVAALGRGILYGAPYMMKTLSVVGTAAMFMVGGGILTHGFHAVSEWIAGVAVSAGTVPGVGAVIAGITPTLINAAVGIVAGAVTLGVVMLVKRVIGGRRKTA
jgi:predicted DNA repair protein MutK